MEGKFVEAGQKTDSLRGELVGAVAYPWGVAGVDVIVNSSEDDVDSQELRMATTPQKNNVAAEFALYKLVAFKLTFSLFKITKSQIICPRKRKYNFFTLNTFLYSICRFVA